MENIMKKDALNYLAFKESYPEIINRNMDKFKQYIDPCIESLKKRISKDPSRMSYALKLAKEFIPEAFNNPEAIKSFDDAIVVGIKNKLSEEPGNYDRYKKEYPEAFETPEIFKESLINGIKNKIMDDFYTVFIYKKMFPEIFLDQEQFKSLLQNEIKKEININNYLDLKKQFPEIFNDQEFVKSLEEKLISAIKKNISESPSSYIKLKKAYPKLFDNNHELEDILIKTLEKSIDESIVNKYKPLDVFSFYTNYKDFYREELYDLNNIKLRNIKDKLIGIIKREKNDQPDKYLNYQRYFPEIFKNTEIFNEEIINEIEARIRKDIISYASSFHELYKRAFPEIFNNSEMLEDLISMEIEKQLNYRIKNYKPFFYHVDYPSERNRGLKVMLDRDYDIYKKTFPEILEKYNIQNPSEQVLISSNWYKLFKSSKKNLHKGKSVNYNE